MSSVTVEEIFKMKELKEQGLNNKEIGKELGRSSSTVSNWLSTLERLESRLKSDRKVEKGQEKEDSPPEQKTKKLNSLQLVEEKERQKYEKRSWRDRIVFLRREITDLKQELKEVKSRVKKVEQRVNGIPSPQEFARKAKKLSKSSCSDLRKKVSQLKQTLQLLIWKLGINKRL